MAIEFIGEFQSYTPYSYDKITPGRGHIEGLKLGYLGSFPYFNAALDYSATELNIMYQSLDAVEDGLKWLPLSDVNKIDYVWKVKANTVVVAEHELPPVGTIIPVFFGPAEFTNLYPNVFQLCDGTEITSKKINDLKGDPYTVPDLVGKEDSIQKYARMAPTEVEIGDVQEDMVDISEWEDIAPYVEAGDFFTTTGDSENHTHRTPQTPQGDGKTPSGFYENNGAQSCDTFSGQIYSTDYDFKYYRRSSTTNGQGNSTITKGTASCVSSRGNTKAMSFHEYVTAGNADHTHALTSKEIEATITSGGTLATETKPDSFEVRYFMRVD